jgi:hypothetical protein
VTDPIATAPSMTLISAESRLGADLTAAINDDPVLDRLATWLAEVSADATMLRPAGEAASTAREPTD